MTRGKSDSYWPAADERLVVEEMIRNRNSKYWEECSKFVMRRVYAQAKNIPVDYLEEISQEVMYRVAKRLPGFHFQSALTTWLNIIVEHCIIDIHRKWQNLVLFNVPLGDPPNESDRESEVITASETRSAEDVSIINDDLRNAVVALLEYTNAHSNPTRDRLIIQMVIFSGHSHKEAAEAVGCNPPVVGYVVREAQSYARKKMGYQL